jgi:hypothetical protein
LKLSQTPASQRTADDPAVLHPDLTHFMVVEESSRPIDDFDRTGQQDEATADINEWMNSW